MGDDRQRGLPGPHHGTEAPLGEHPSPPADRTNHPSLSGQSAGWYADPRDNGGLRWWDGGGWTDDVADSASSGAMPPAPAGSDPLSVRVAGRARFKRPYVVGSAVGMLALIIGASIWAIESGRGGPSSRSLSASIATTAPTTPGPAPASGLGSQSITLTPATGLHDGEVIHIVATGYVPGVDYYSMECRAGSYVADDCNTGEFDSTTADMSGTVTLDYKVVKGPFGAHHVICSPAQPCMIGVAGGQGNDVRAASTNLDFR